MPTGQLSETRFKLFLGQHWLWAAHVGLPCPQYQRSARVCPGFPKGNPKPGCRLGPNVDIEGMAGILGQPIASVVPEIT